MLILVCLLHALCGVVFTACINLAMFWTDRHCEYSLAAIDPTRDWLMYLACLFTCFIYCCCVCVDVVLYFTCNTTLLIMIPYPIKEGKRICGSIVFLQLKVCCDVILTPFLSTLLNAKEIIIQL